MYTCFVMHSTFLFLSFICLLCVCVCFFCRVFSFCSCVFVLWLWLALQGRRIQHRQECLSPCKLLCQCCEMFYFIPDSMSTHRNSDSGAPVLFWGYLKVQQQYTRFSGSRDRPLLLLRLSGGLKCQSTGLYPLRLLYFAQGCSEMFTRSQTWKHASLFNCVKTWAGACLGETSTHFIHCNDWGTDRLVDVMGSVFVSLAQGAQDGVAIFFGNLANISQAHL